MTIEPIYFVGTHHWSFRPNKPAEITGVIMVTPDGLPPRACFSLRYPDGQVDYHPISDASAYKLVSKAEIHDLEAPRA